MPTPTEEMRFLAPIDDIEVRDSGAGDGQWTFRGHAAVYDKLSHDLGGFREKLARGAFTDVLDGNPDVHFDWDHNTRYVFACTDNKTLELREDPMGLHVWARVAPVSYADDLRVLLERGDIKQMSFMFRVHPKGSDEWHENDQGEITRTINKIGELYDVTVCAQGAYPQTDAQLATRILTTAIEEGRVPGRAASPPAEPEEVDGTADADAGPVVVSNAARQRQVAQLGARLSVARRRSK